MAKQFDMRILLVVGICVALGYLVYTRMYQAPHDMQMNNVEAFQSEAPADTTVVYNEAEQSESEQQQYTVDASEQIGENEQPRPVQEVQMGQGVSQNQLPSECYPKDVLSSAELLPRDANSLYAQVNPSGQGSLQDQNFLTAGYHIGINTVGQSLRNANRQLRSEPPNPQVKVSPWLQTTIEPDINRRPLEIAGEQ
jgi:hypothetical protein